MNPLKKLIIMFILSVSAYLTFSKTEALIVRDISENRIIFTNKISPGNEFKVRWMHSVELQPWEEIFRIGEEYDIVLDRTRFKSFGAGVPDSAGKKTEIKNGYVVFSGIDKKIVNLRYGVSDFSKHRFYFKNKELKLYEIVKNGNGINIYTSRLNLFKYYILKIITFRI